MKSSLAILLTCVSVVAVTAQADSWDTLTVYRGVDGNYSKQSKENFHALWRKARKEGRVTIDIGFEMDFEGNPELRTSEVVHREALEKQELIVRVVMPLVEYGIAEIVPMPDALSGAPGCRASVTARALPMLFSNVDVKLISYNGA